MSIVRSIGIFIGIFLIFPSLFAEEGYIGEPLGIDFYTRIDEGSYSINQKMVTKKLDDQTKNKNNTIWKQCVAGSIQKQASKGLDVSSAKTQIILDQLDRLDYSGLMQLLKEQGAQNITIDSFQNTTQCLSNEYTKIKADATNEQSRVETLASLGLYMDNDTNNSEYDILTDIGKINGILFSETIKYNGTQNRSAGALANYLDGKTESPSYFFTHMQTIQSGSTLSGNTDNSGSIHSGMEDTNLLTLLGGACTASGSNSAVSVDAMVDDAFLEDLASTLAGDTGPSENLGSTRSSSDKNGNTTSLTGSVILPTSAGDFFHTMPCDSIFCIKTRFVAGNQNLLGGGKTTSIESILDTHTAILDKIATSALRAEHMTKNFGESGIFNLKFLKTLNGGRIYLGSDPQRSRRDKKDATPNQKEAEYENARRCAFSNAGLNTDKIQANGFMGNGYFPTNADTTESISKRNGSQGTIEVNKNALAGCMQVAMDSGRKTYYDSFSTDLTEVASFTKSLVDELTQILSIGSSLYGKPMYQP